MHGVTNDHRRDLEIGASIFRAAILDLYSPVGSGHGDFPFALRPPAVYILTMYEHP